MLKFSGLIFPFQGIIKFSLNQMSAEVYKGAIYFVNGTNGYNHPVTTAHITALENDSQEEFHIFYK
jgi:hypothetical protein